MWLTTISFHTFRGMLQIFDKKPYLKKLDYGTGIDRSSHLQKPINLHMSSIDYLCLTWLKMEVDKVAIPQLTSRP